MLKRLAVASVVATLLPLRAAALETDGLLALVAMPLAVAAVSEMTDVPRSDLIDVVTLMNEAAVPPAQFVEVVRYVPVALVMETEPRFVDFVRERRTAGLRGTQLVTVIEDRFRVMGVPADLDVVAPRVVETGTAEIIPPFVRSRVAEVKAHPHGGPPGQMKKANDARIAHDRGKGKAKGHGHAKGKGHGKGKGKG